MSKICLVTGASTGIGRGIALELALHGHHVMITGRNSTTLEQVESDFSDLKSASCQGKIIPKVCDHSNDEQVENLFKSLDRLDVLVNNAFSAVNAIGHSIGKKFWELDVDMWDQVNHVGLRNHYRCSVFAAHLFQKDTLSPKIICTIGSAGGAMRLFNAAYGVGKEAKDRLACEMAAEFRKQPQWYSFGLWPGAVRTEKLMDSMEKGNFTDQHKQMFANGETTRFAGKCVAAILNKSSDAKFMKTKVTGKIIQTSDIGKALGLRDTDGRVVPSMLSIKMLCHMGGYTKLAAWIPAWLCIPKWMFVRENFGKRF